MVVPLIPILAIATISGASYLLAWYAGLSNAEKAAADDEAIAVAKRLFGISQMAELAPEQAAKVQAVLENKRTIPRADKARRL